MRVLFLDFAGVITSMYTRFRMSKVHQERLKRLFDTYPDLRIVITSGCRRGYKTITELLNKISPPTDYFLCKEFDTLRNPKYPVVPYMFSDITIDMTPTEYSKRKFEEFGVERGYEIDAWLDEHPEVTKYAIVDSDCDMGSWQLPYFVHTNCQAGITDNNVDELINILKD